jgi:isopentenyl-diphosphate Delta-isomerase
MGLGSCRYLLTDDTYLNDFNVRSIMGDALPLYANLGIAQIEELLSENKLTLLDRLIEKLSVDGLIVHINPMQEWLQPEGDRVSKSPLDTLIRLIDQRPEMLLIVKEVGQGMGYNSLKALMELPIQAIEFAAAGGTNFALVELQRRDTEHIESYQPFTTIGHTALEMVEFSNDILAKHKERILCKELIISGGIGTFLDGYYALKKSNATAIYGQAAGFLKHARGSYEDLEQFCKLQIDGLRMAQAFLTVR